VLQLAVPVLALGGAVVMLGEPASARLLLVSGLVLLGIALTIQRAR
jgi:drug/metabolite transporter (DMT)-like permease